MHGLSGLQAKFNLVSKGGARLVVDGDKGIYLTCKSAVNDIRRGTDGQWAGPDKKTMSASGWTRNLVREINSRKNPARISHCTIL